MSSKTDIAIRVDGLSKAYTISHNVKHDSLAETIAHKFKNNGTPQTAASREIFWALKDVSFEINQGDSVGIIGRNGAGKSTLLKVLSRITEPTEGRAELRGRVGSLLEVGTGFHPDLTGRENVYLNGTILGMTRGEITKHFDSIVDFSGTERFLDTPVKRYSSGMYVRLAFAIAAHLEPEILIIDEVLAVGDAEFQKKCLGKMKDVSESGRTVLYVSHSIETVMKLCNRAIYLANGQIVAQGDTASVIDEYVNYAGRLGAEVTWDASNSPGNDEVKMKAVRLLNSDHVISSTVTLSEQFAFEIDFEVVAPNLQVNPHIHLSNTRGTLIFTTSNRADAKWGNKKFSPGHYSSTVYIPHHLLNNGEYVATPILTRDSSTILAQAEDALQFEVLEDGSGRGAYAGVWGGAVRPMLKWEMISNGAAPNESVVEIGQ